MSLDYCNAAVSLALLVLVRAKGNSPWRKTCSLHRIEQMRESSFGNDTGSRDWKSARGGGGAVTGAHGGHHSARSHVEAGCSRPGCLVRLLIHLDKRLETSGLQGTVQQPGVSLSRDHPHPQVNTKPTCGAASGTSLLLLQCPLPGMSKSFHRSGRSFLSTLR